MSRKIKWRIPVCVLVIGLLVNSTALIGQAEENSMVLQTDEAAEADIGEGELSVSGNTVSISGNEISVSENSITVSGNVITPDEIRYEGSCGENTEFSFDRESGTLTVTGSGKLYEYETFRELPWSDYYGEIKHIVLGNGVQGKLWYFVKEYYKGQ